MEFKPDWEAAQNRLLAYWNHAVIDRCCLAVHAPRQNARLPAFPDLQNGSWLGGLEALADEDQAGLRQWWTDPDLNYERALAWFENNYFGGEALPVTYVNWGAMSMAAMFGSPAEFKKTSVWYPAIIDNWETWDSRFDAAVNPTWQTILRIVERLVAGAPGRYFVGKPELGNGADVLSLIRGMDKLALDLKLQPAAVHHAVDVISTVWVQLMEQAYQLTTPVNAGGDVLAWMGLWAPGRIDQIACDFSSVISPKMFREFFVPEIEKMGNWCQYGTYHLDGPACLKNMLETLLTIPSLKAIQFTPGAGSPPTYTEHYLPRYRQILESGRNLYLLVQPQEVEKVLAALPPEGLFMRVYVETQEDAEAMLHKVAHWTARRNIFPRP
ncbi:MAG: hypothetical protein JNK29_03300 [Anaerolineales bacterium]|nr:hypothetical protein [Anaerolineales bacterium]